jgi:hypothetical protein
LQYKTVLFLVPQTPVFRPAKLAIIIVIGIDFRKNKGIFSQHFEIEATNQNCELSNQKTRHCFSNFELKSIALSKIMEKP